MPRPPDAGFFGRDETLLALDRAFDTHQVVLLHAFAGAGKSATAAEFARWYQATGGLDLPSTPEWPGAVLWSSFEHHLTADRVIGTAGDYFAPLLEASGIAWAAVDRPGQRRDIVMQVLTQVPVLWVWDNVEPVTGFPAGTLSDWTPAEQAELADLLRDLAQRTQCKVLLTSRRDEHGWLGDLPARVRAAADADAGEPATRRRAGGPAWPRACRPGLAAAAAVCGRKPAHHHRAGRPGAAREPRHRPGRSRTSWRGCGATRRNWRPGRTWRSAARDRWPPRSVTASTQAFHRWRAGPAGGAAPVPRHRQRRRASLDGRSRSDQ